MLGEMKGGPRKVVDIWKDDVERDDGIFEESLDCCFEQNWAGYPIRHTTRDESDEWDSFASEGGNDKRNILCIASIEDDPEDPRVMH